MNQYCREQSETTIPATSSAPRTRGKGWQLLRLTAVSLSSNQCPTAFVRSLSSCSHTTAPISYIQSKTYFRAMRLHVKTTLWNTFRPSRAAYRRRLPLQYQIYRNNRLRFGAILRWLSLLLKVVLLCACAGTILRLVTTAG